MLSFKLILLFIAIANISSDTFKHLTSNKLEKILNKKLLNSAIRTSSSSRYDPTNWVYDCDCLAQNSFKKCTEWYCSQKDVSGASCFPSGAKVQLTANITKRVDDLQQGDRIVTFGENGDLIEDEILGFLHYEADKNFSFLEIKTSNDEENLLISKNHIIFEKEEGSKLAKELNLNSSLLQVQSNGKFETQKIIEITNVIKKGAFAPLTKSGTLLVNGKLVSCYANYKNHYLAHQAFGPLRFMYNNLPNEMKFLVDSKINNVNWYAKGLMWMFRRFIDERE